jgi:hypothetical protein
VNNDTRDISRLTVCVFWNEDAHILLIVTRALSLQNKGRKEGKKRIYKWPKDIG